MQNYLVSTKHEACGVLKKAEICKILEIHPDDRMILFRRFFTKNLLIEHTASKETKRFRFLFGAVIFSLRLKFNK